MQTSVINLIREGLLEKRETLKQWQVATPEPKKEIELGNADETAVQTEPDIIDSSLQKMETGEFGLCEVCHEPVDSELLQMDYISCVCLSHYSEAELRQLESELDSPRPSSALCCRPGSPLFPVMTLQPSAALHK